MYMYYTYNRAISDPPDIQANILSNLLHYYKAKLARSCK